MRAVMERIFAISYYAGVQTVRLLHRSGRFFAFILQPVLFFLRRTVGQLFARMKAAVGEVFRSIGQGFKRVGHYLKHAPLRAIGLLLRSPILLFRRHPKLGSGLLRLVAFAASIVLLVGTVRYWGGITYAMALEYEQEIWGYVADEQVLMTGAAMAAERVGSKESFLDTAIRPSIALSMVHETAVLTAEEVCDLLLKNSGLSLTRACGLYLDNVFYGAIPTRSKAERMLDEILEESRNGEQEMEASFFQHVELVDGLYAEGSVYPADVLKDKLAGEYAGKELYTVAKGDTLERIAEQVGISVADLKTLNPKMGKKLKEGERLVIRDGKPPLQVLVSGTIQYEVETAYTTERMPDNSEYKGYERVRVRGKNGIDRITAKVTYLNGEELYSQIVASEVVKEPTTQIVAYGTKKVTSKKYKGGPYATGRFVWPVPYTRYITQHFGHNGHGGMDISDSNITGQDIIASDGGVVIVSAYRKGTSYGSYGKYIVIDHGGGYQSLYAHCSELLVNVGDVVKQGQVIAKVGNTGKSTGPHLHFEIQVNGRRVNPKSYL